jgi:hypothetical protein
MSEVDSQPQDPDQELAQAFVHGRAHPSAEFRGALRRHLIESDPGHGPRPDRLAGIVFGYGLAGLALMAIGLLQAGGWL